MGSILNNVLAVSLGLVVLVVVASSILLPQFSTSWRYCQAREWKCADGGTTTNCTTPYATSNTTQVVLNATGSATSHTELGLTESVETDDCSNHTNVDNFCLNCDTAGGYRSATQGLLLLGLVLGLMGLGIKFILPKVYR